MDIGYSNILQTIYSSYIHNFNIFVKHIGLRKTLHVAYRVSKARLLGYPPDVTIETARFCNLKCPMCIQAKSMTEIERQQKLLSLENFKQVIDDVKGFAVQVSLFYGGEPLLNKELPQMIRYATDSGLLTYVNTNGVLLDTPERRARILESGLTRLHISFDGAHPETYHNYRVGASFKKVRENIRNLVIERGALPTPIIAMQMIATNRTLPEIEEYRRLSEALDIDKAFCSTLYVDQYRQNAPQSLLDDVPCAGRYSRYEEIKNGRAILKKERAKFCPSNRTTYILTDGTLLHCCYDYEAEYTFGNAFETNVKELWNAPEYVKWRKEKAYPMKLPLCHKSCTVGIPNQWVTLYEK